MTYRESEFPGMIKQLETILNKYPPAAVAWYAREMARIYHAIPVYPGLVGVCLGKAFEACPMDNPPPKGALLVVWPKHGEPLAGKLSAWSKAVVQIDVPGAPAKHGRVKIPKSGVRLIERFRTDTLEAFWPTLVFDKKTPARRK
ncbi:MAG: hypothetical protein A3G34_00920 [Candidatus Lindowbacteria bacterium RIFCSPLOWO2_12_FULL_62_27]|nr:MAG: hypothetical protein A3G34_00920 [Candidatus Lindowbacteria bacterium RIFCSPLOWO2_12_FULL_62_27]